MEQIQQRGTVWSDQLGLRASLGGVVDTVEGGMDHLFGCVVGTVLRVCWTLLPWAYWIGGVASAVMSIRILYTLISRLCRSVLAASVSNQDDLLGCHS